MPTIFLYQFPDRDFIKSDKSLQPSVKTHPPFFINAFPIEASERNAEVLRKSVDFIACNQLFSFLVKC